MAIGPLAYEMQETAELDIYFASYVKKDSSYGHQIWYTKWSWGTLVWGWFLVKRSKVKVIRLKSVWVSVCIILQHHCTSMTFTRWRHHILLTTRRDSYEQFGAIYLFSNLLKVLQFGVDISVSHCVVNSSKNSLLIPNLNLNDTAYFKYIWTFRF